MIKKFSILEDVAQAKSVSSLVENVTNIAQRTFNSCKLVKIDGGLANEHSKLKSRLSTKEAEVKVGTSYKQNLFIEYTILIYSDIDNLS